MLIMPNNSSISGTVYNDIDGDAKRNSGERSLAGQTIFLDVDRDRQFDVASRHRHRCQRELFDRHARMRNTARPFPSAARSSVRGWCSNPGSQSQLPESLNGYEFQRLQPNVPLAGVALGLSRTAIIQGTAYIDSNHNGQKDADEFSKGSGTAFVDLNDNDLIDDNEPQATTSPSGTWMFPVGLEGGRTSCASSRGRITSLPDLPATHTASSSSTARRRRWRLDGFPKHTMNHSQNHSHFIIEAIEPHLLLAGTGSISGTMFWDIDRDGIRDADEKVAAYAGVGIDSNNDGIASGEEPFADVDLLGVFKFERLEAGTYVLETRFSEQMPTSPRSGRIAVTIADGEARMA